MRKRLKFHNCEIKTAQGGDDGGEGGEGDRRQTADTIVRALASVSLISHSSCANLSRADNYKIANAPPSTRAVDYHHNIQS